MVDYRCNPESARTQAIENGLEQHETTGDKDTWPVPWKGQQTSLPLIRVALENLALNHRSHRIRAQLEDVPEAQEALAQPDGPEAQEYIAIAIVNSSEHWGDLSADLDRVGQTAPGVVTRAGVLVNGNRRAVALREGGKKWMDVAVLPPGVSSNEIDDLEFDLQIAKEFREDYTFTNRLIVINELLVERAESAKDIGLRIGWTRSNDDAELKKGERRVEQAIRLLSMIRTLQDLSKHKGCSLRLSYFDDKQQSLEELDNQCLQLEEEGEDLATIESVKNFRLVGMLAGLTKLQLRRIKADFYEEYLKPQLDEEDADSVREVLAETSTSSPGAIPGLSSAEDHGAAGGGTPKFLSQLATSVGLEEAGRAAQDVSLPADVCEKLADVMGDAIDIAGSQTNKANRLRAPIESIKKARRAVQSAQNQFVKVQSETQFKTGDMHYQLKKLEKQTGAIRSILESSNG